MESWNCSIFDRQFNKSHFQVWSAKWTRRFNAVLNKILNDLIIQKLNSSYSKDIYRCHLFSWENWTRVQVLGSNTKLDPEFLFRKEFTLHLQFHLFCAIFYRLMSIFHVNGLTPESNDKMIIRFYLTYQHDSLSSIHWLNDFDITNKKKK